jgi:hypothetical protein
MVWANSFPACVCSLILNVLSLPPRAQDERGDHGSDDDEEV